MKAITVVIACFSLVGSFAADSSPDKIFSPTVSGKPSYDHQRELVQKFYTALQDNDADALKELLASDYHVVNAGEVQDSSYSKFTEMSKNIKVRMLALHKALPNFTLTISDVLIDDNKALARVSISGLQQGPFLGIVPTQKPIHIKFFDLFTFKDGKISHIAEMWNELSVMRQLGYIVL